MCPTLKLDVIDFLQAPGTIFDVRSPGEYAQGRLPGARSLPLFSDAERAAVGTLYKQVGKEQAIEQGLEFVGPKLASFVTGTKTHLQGGLAKIHCWRGGMRSSSMAWLLQTAGLRTATLQGGYKAFRRWVLECFQQPRHLVVLGGLTGSGKTSILHALQHQGEQVLDLEELAGHRGSSYGMVGMHLPQPSNEQFENEIAYRLAAFNPQRRIWVEDESRLLGKCQIPNTLYQQIRAAPLIYIDCPLAERLERLLQEYGSAPAGHLIDSTERLGRRLGGAKTKEIIALIQAGELKPAIELSLQYYDRTYRYGLSHRTSPITTLSEAELSAADWARLLIEKAATLKGSTHEGSTHD